MTKVNLSKKQGQKVDVEDLVPVYVPSLYELLLIAEQKKGSPLTESEVVSLRDTATVVMMHRTAAEAVCRNRAVVDIDADHVWAEWQQRRQQSAP